MIWRGAKIKDLSIENKLSLQKIADLIDVSRQTVNDWIKGQIPKGNHLIALCKIFHVEPDDFFSEDPESKITIPVHRTRRNAKVKEEMQNASIELAKEYELLFRNYSESTIVPVIKSIVNDKENAIKIANDLRLKSNISGDIPIDYEHTFKLAEILGINIIFRKFPDKIKDYAFYTKINNHRVVFVNSSTNILDLIFPILHEFVHAIQDKEADNGCSKEEEDFCDMVSNYSQFPESHVKFVYNTIINLEKPAQINTLKTFARQYKYSLLGIVKSINYIFPEFSLKVGGADTNLKKQFPAINKILFQSPDPDKYVELLYSLSPGFIRILIQQLDDISYRKLKDLLDIESTLDAKEIKIELQKLKDTLRRK